jgi:hypothetical protein
MTKREWEILWWEEFRKLRDENPTTDLIKVQKAAHQYMKTRYGECPPDEPGPAWWMKLGAAAMGVPMDWLQKIWDFMNGKKTAVGLIITALAFLAGFVPALMAALGVEALLVAKVAGVLTTIVGIAHKVYKFVYKEEHV